MWLPSFALFCDIQFFELLVHALLYKTQRCDITDVAYRNAFSSGKVFDWRILFMAHAVSLEEYGGRTVQLPIGRHCFIFLDDSGFWVFLSEFSHDVWMPTNEDDFLSREDSGEFLLIVDVQHFRGSLYSFFDLLSWKLLPQPGVLFPQSFELFLKVRDLLLLGLDLGLDTCIAVSGILGRTLCRIGTSSIFFQ